MANLGAVGGLALKSEGSPVHKRDREPKFFNMRMHGNNVVGVLKEKAGKDVSRHRIQRWVPHSFLLKAEEHSIKLKDLKHDPASFHEILVRHHRAPDVLGDARQMRHPPSKTLAPPEAKKDIPAQEPVQPPPRPGDDAFHPRMAAQHSVWDFQPRMGFEPWIELEQQQQLLRQRPV